MRAEPLWGSALMKKQQQHKRAMLIALHETAGIAWHTIDKVMRAVGERLHLADTFSDRDWQEAGLAPKQRAALLAGLNDGSLLAAESRYKQLGAEIVTREDPDYPSLLLQTARAPWVLYTLGRRELLSRPSIAVVGARVPTAYGRHVSATLSGQLVSVGFTVVSGMAKGIDRFAHEGALAAASGPSTIAVLGTPIHEIYPPEHRQLFRKIAEQGLLVSEYPLGTRLHPGLFPQRNRIIAGLTLGTLVVEAAEHSGSLITAAYAQEMNRELFAVPGQIHSPRSKGTNRLIKETGAKLVMGAEDIVEEFRFREDIVMRLQSAAPPYSEGGQEQPNLSAEEEKILAIIQDKSSTIDELLERSGMTFGLLHAVLINLTIKQCIEQHAGAIYRAL